MAQQRHVLEFSPNGKLFSVINVDGKLLIWDTETSILKQTYTLSTNANANCTALTWIVVASSKKKRKSLELASPLFIALGTSKGRVELYSYGTGKIEYSLTGSGHSGPVNGIYYDQIETIFTCGADGNVIRWSLNDRTQISSMKIGSEIPYSLIVFPESQSLITSGRQLKLWNLENNELIQTYAGHTSSIFVIKSFNINSKYYVLSGSNSDRILSLWYLSPKAKYKNSIATFLMENVAICLNCHLMNGILKIVAVTRSGVVHHFIENFATLKTDKPIKPKVTIEIVSNSTTTVEAIPSIVATLEHSKSDDEILIGYGEKQFLYFENIPINLSKKNQIEIRNDPRKIRKQKENLKQEFGTVFPTVDHSQVVYHTPTSSINRKTSGKSVLNDLPMETRLENLSVSNDTEKGPKAANMAQLLIQGLHSKDDSILRLVFACTDEKTIQLTLQKLPPQYFTNLIDELGKLLRKKPSHVQTGVIWLKHLLQTHSSQLISIGSQALYKQFGPCIGIIEHRIGNLQSLSRVRGRLDLLVNQIKRKNVDEDILDNSNMLVYQDENSENENDDLEQESESSDEHWEENDEDEDNEEEDEEMEVSENEDNNVI